MEGDWYLLHPSLLCISVMGKSLPSPDLAPEWSRGPTLREHGVSWKEYGDVLTCA